ncbi:MAG TPA: hypothetical protein VNO21_04025 [Polyangiaceae bacterium]|nr:hypothetical protein [Polyangiaceae bacterium]
MTTDATTLIGKAFDSTEVQNFAKELKVKPKVDKDADEIVYNFKRAGISLSAEPRSKRINTIFFYSDTYKGVLPHGVKFSLTLEAVEKLLGRPEFQFDNEYEHSRSWEFEAYKLYVNFDTEWHMTTVTVTGA